MRERCGGVGQGAGGRTEVHTGQARRRFLQLTGCGGGGRNLIQKLAFGEGKKKVTGKFAERGGM